MTSRRCWSFLASILLLTFPVAASAEKEPWLDLMKEVYKEAKSVKDPKVELLRGGEALAFESLREAVAASRDGETIRLGPGLHGPVEAPPGRLFVGAGRATVLGTKDFDEKGSKDVRVKGGEFRDLTLLNPAFDNDGPVWLVNVVNLSLPGISDRKIYQVGGETLNFLPQAMMGTLIRVFERIKNENGKEELSPEQFILPSPGRNPLRAYLLRTLDERFAHLPPAERDVIALDELPVGAVNKGASAEPLPVESKTLPKLAKDFVDWLKTADLTRIDVAFQSKGEMAESNDVNRALAREMYFRFGDWLSERHGLKAAAVVSVGSLEKGRSELTAGRPLSAVYHFSLAGRSQDPAEREASRKALEEAYAAVPPPPVLRIEFENRSGVPIPEPLQRQFVEVARYRMAASLPYVRLSLGRAEGGEPAARFVLLMGTATYKTGFTGKAVKVKEFVQDYVNPEKAAEAAAEAERRRRAAEVKAQMDRIDATYQKARSALAQQIRVQHFDDRIEITKPDYDAIRRHERLARETADFRRSSGRPPDIRSVYQMPFDTTGWRKADPDRLQERYELSVEQWRKDRLVRRYYGQEVIAEMHYSYDVRASFKGESVREGGASLSGPERSVSDKWEVRREEYRGVADDRHYFGFVFAFNEKGHKDPKNPWIKQNEALKAIESPPPPPELAIQDSVPKLLGLAFAPDLEEAAKAALLPPLREAVRAAAAKQDWAAAAEAALSIARLGAYPEKEDRELFKRVFGADPFETEGDAYEAAFIAAARRAP